ncbi:hypothetical protein BH23THE1_BH23THE1_15390 [soil metagenome]
MSSSDNIEWNQMIKKEARGKGDDDLGEVQEIHQENVITKVGLIDKSNIQHPKELCRYI